jgi:succinate dehydrogenase / fumarate reductase membrane anchor subunit
MGTLGGIMKKGFRETSKKGGIPWLVQRISAVIIFVIIMIHFVTYHLLSEGAFKWDKVVSKMKSPWFNLMQFLLLCAVLYHGLNGVWMVVEDYIHIKGLRLFLFSLIIVVGISLFFVGVLTIIKVSNFNLEILRAGAIK